MLNVLDAYVNRIIERTEIHTNSIRSQISVARAAKKSTKNIPRVKMLSLAKHTSIVTRGRNFRLLSTKTHDVLNQAVPFEDFNAFLVDDVLKVKRNGSHECFTASHIEMFFIPCTYLWL